MLDVFNVSFYRCIENFHFRADAFHFHCVFTLRRQCMIFCILRTNKKYITLYYSFYCYVAPIIVDLVPVWR